MKAQKAILLFIGLLAFGLGPSQAQEDAWEKMLAETAWQKMMDELSAGFDHGAADLLPAAIRLVEYAERNLGSSHVSTAASYRALGIVQLREGSHALAATNFERARPVFESTYGSTGAETLSLLLEITHAYQGLGQYRSAEQVFMQRLQRIEAAGFRPYPVAIAKSVFALKSEPKTSAGTGRHVKAAETAYVLNDFPVPETWAALYFPAAKVIAYGQSAFLEGVLRPGAVFGPVGNTEVEFSRVSGDGSVLLGYRGSFTDRSHFRVVNGNVSELRALRDTTGMNPAFPAAVNADGSVVVGRRDLNGFLWSEKGLTTIRTIKAVGPLPAYSLWTLDAAGVSADGRVVAGTAETHDKDRLIRQPFRWTAEHGAVTLKGFERGPMTVANATAISANGEVVVGHGQSKRGNEAFRWSAREGMVALGDLPGGEFRSSATAVSADGSVVVGHSVGRKGTEAFLWAAGKMTGLGDLPGGEFYSLARHVTADGRRVFGVSSTANGQEAFVWDSRNGMRLLADVLRAELAEINGWRLNSVNGISADGSVLVGTGTNPDGVRESWLIHGLVQ